MFNDICCQTALIVDLGENFYTVGNVLENQMVYSSIICVSQTVPDKSGEIGHFLPEFLSAQINQDTHPCLLLCANTDHWIYVFGYLGIEKQKEQQIM